MNEDGKIDYSQYTYRELLESLNNINAAKYPKNYANLQAALEKIGPVQKAGLDHADTTEPLFPDDDFDDEPNPEDPDLRRIRHLLTAMAVAGVSAYLLWLGDLTLPFDPPIRISLADHAVSVGYLALFFALAVPVSFVVDAFDPRDNRKNYLVFAWVAETVATGLIFFASAMSATPL